VFSNLSKITGTSHEGLCKSVLLTVRNFSDKTCGQNQNMRFVLKYIFSADRAACGIMWQNMMGPD
jgi:hypothetical protein